MHDKFMRYVLIFICITTQVYANQGLKISCLNMLAAVGEKHENENFSVDAINFEYFDKNTNKYKQIKTKDLLIGDNYFTARLNKYEITFQNMLFKDYKKEIMLMSKYDYKKNSFLGHYFCDYTVTNIK